MIEATIEGMLHSRVASGAHHLDRLYPGWTDSVDIDTLDLAYGPRHLLTQLAPIILGDNWKPTRNTYFEAVDAILAEMNYVRWSVFGRLWMQAHGFAIDLHAAIFDNDDDEYAQLTEAWKREIQARTA